MHISSLLLLLLTAAVSSTPGILDNTGEMKDTTSKLVVIGCAVDL